MEESITEVLIEGGASPKEMQVRMGACAMSLGHSLAQSWTQSVAAAHLGVRQQTVATLLKRGKLDRHSDGGLVIGDVIRYGEQRRT